MLLPRKAYLKRTRILRAHRYTGPSRKTLKLLHDRCGGICEFPACTRVATDPHHRKPRRMGGRSDPAINRLSNLTFICRSCHLWLEENRADAYDMGWLLLERESAGEVPIAMDGGAYLLSDDGGRELMP